MKEQEDARLHAERLKNEVHAPLRGLLLRDYVNAIRTSIHEERKQEKRNKINEQLQKYVYLLCAGDCLLLTCLISTGLISIESENKRPSYKRQD